MVFQTKRNTYHPQKPALTRYFEDMFGRTCNWWVKSFTDYQYLSNNVFPWFKRPFPYPCRLLFVFKTICKQDFGIKIIHKSPPGLLDNVLLNVFWCSHPGIGRPNCMFLFCCQSSNSLETVEYSSFALCNWAQRLLDSDWLMKMHHIT